MACSRRGPPRYRIVPRWTRSGLKTLLRLGGAQAQRRTCTATRSPLGRHQKGFGRCCFERENLSEGVAHVRTIGRRKQHFAAKFGALPADGRDGSPCSAVLVSGSIGAPRMPTCRWQLTGLRLSWRLGAVALPLVPETASALLHARIEARFGGSPFDESCCHQTSHRRGEAFGHVREHGAEVVVGDSAETGIGCAAIDACGE